MRIADLPIAHLNQLSNEAALQLVLQVRQHRRERPARAQHVPRMRKAKEVSTAALLKGATREQLEELLHALTK